MVQLPAVAFSRPHGRVHRAAPLYVKFNPRSRHALRCWPTRTGPPSAPGLADRSALRGPDVTRLPGHLHAPCAPPRYRSRSSFLDLRGGAPNGNASRLLASRRTRSCLPERMHALASEHALVSRVGRRARLPDFAPAPSLLPPRRAPSLLAQPHVITCRCRHVVPHPHTPMDMAPCQSAPRHFDGYSAPAVRKWGGARLARRCQGSTSHFALAAGPSCFHARACSTAFIAYGRRASLEGLVIVRPLSVRRSGRSNRGS